MNNTIPSSGNTWSAPEGGHSSEGRELGAQFEHVVARGIGNLANAIALYPAPVAETVPQAEVASVTKIDSHPDYRWHGAAPVAEVTDTAAVVSDGAGEVHHEGVATDTQDTRSQDDAAADDAVAAARQAVMDSLRAS